MPFLIKGKTNWKFILIVLILAILVVGGILGYLRFFEREMLSLTKFPETKKPEKVIEKNRKNIFVKPTLTARLKELTVQAVSLIWNASIENGIIVSYNFFLANLVLHLLPHLFGQRIANALTQSV